MKGFKYVPLLILVLVIFGAVYVTVQPDNFEVTRSRTIKAPASVLYDQIIDFRKWEAWSPWIERDSTITLIYSDTTEGVGASYSWIEKDGKGSMTTLSAEDNASIEQSMQFEDFPASSIRWSFEPLDSDETEVSWTIAGDNLPFGFKLFAVFSGSMEEQIGPDFERGLEKLDSIALASMKVYSVTIEGVTEHGGGYYLHNTTSSKISDFESKMMGMMPKLEAYAAQNNISIAGAPFVNFLKWDEANNATIFSCCIPTTAKVISTEADILTGQLLPFKALKTTLKGDYENLKEAWDQSMAYVTDNELTFADTGPMREAYHKGPADTANPAEWVTEIYIALK